MNHSTLKLMSALDPNGYKRIDQPFLKIDQIHVISLGKVLLHPTFRVIADLVKVNQENAVANPGINNLLCKRFS